VAHPMALPERKMVHLNHENGSPEPWEGSPRGSILLMRLDAKSRGGFLARRGRVLPPLKSKMVGI